MPCSIGLDAAGGLQPCRVVPSWTLLKSRLLYPKRLFAVLGRRPLTVPDRGRHIGSEEFGCVEPRRATMFPIVVFSDLYGCSIRSADSGRDRGTSFGNDTPKGPKRNNPSNAGVPWHDDANPRLCRPHCARPLTRNETKRSKQGTTPSCTTIRKMVVIGEPRGQGPTGFLPRRTD